MSLTQKCAWCEHEGITTILRFGDEPGVSHGICFYHAHQVEHEVAQRVAIGGVGDPTSSERLRHP